MRGNRGFVGKRKLYSLNDDGASGINNTFDQYNGRIDNKWPKVKKFVSISPNTTSHKEGESITYTVTVDGYENGNDVYYSIVAVTGSVIGGDFTDSTLDGSFTVNASGVGSFSKTLKRDATSESESYKIQIRDRSSAGTLLGESGTITMPQPSYTLTPNNATPNEGDTVRFTLTGTDTVNGTHYWNLSGTAASADDLETLTTGDFSYNGSSGYFDIVIDADYLTEGNETFTAYANVNSTSGDTVASATVTISDTSLTPTATCTPNVSSVDEGSSVTFTVNTTNFASGTLQWEAVLSADMESTDINATSGTVSISGSTGTISITATSDGYTETGQTEEFQVKIINSPDGDGQTLVTSSAVTINDTSTGSAEPQGIDITTSFYEISNRFLASDTYMGNSNDYDGPYDVGEVQTNFSGSGRVYVGVKVTANTTYYNDIPIAGLQIRTGATLLASWIFNTNSGGSGSGWQTYTSEITGSSTQGFPVSPLTASGYTYVNITTGTGTGNFTWATSTGSSNTGAEDGIGDTYKLSGDGGSNTLATVGDAQISQTSSTYYAYRETSGSTQWSGTVMRSPAYTFSGGEYIRIIHAVTGPNGNPMDPDDSLYIAVY
mgnify:FL=1|tara:strand:+ start:937 stop:2754 length:1818 start_codon:yes stop_codon:yes gene_type:complete